MRKMKDSGIEWIGVIPCEWDVSKIKYVVKRPLQYGASESGIDYDEAKPRYIRITDITMNNELKDDGKLSLELNTAKPYLLEDEDILFARSGATVGKTFFFSSKYGVAAFAGYLIRASFNKSAVYPKYVYYNTLGINYDAWKNQAFSQATIQNIGADKYSEFKIPKPPLPEQKKIADFLDAKCADIDQIRADIDKQIEILTDYKKSIITEAVTKGLDPKAKMKDSGIEWIGKIPEHWDVHPLYYYFGERKHKNVLGEEKNLLSISYGKIIRKNIDSKEGLLPENFNGYNIIEKDDIVMRLTDLQNDKRSLRTGLVKEHGIITSAYVTLKAERDLNAVYFHYLLHCYDLLKVLYNMGNGVRQGLNYSELSRMLLIEPPISEQKAIATYLDDKCSEIEATIAEKQKQLETLEDYKKSLIFEYVTGKKDVV